MANNINNTTNFTNFNEGRELYRVWVPLHDDGKAPLISIWIDPTMTALEPCAAHKSTELGGISQSEVSEEIGPRAPIIVLARGTLHSLAANIQSSERQVTVKGKIANKTAITNKGDS